MSADKKQHWEDAYTNKTSTEVSWFQPAATQSLLMIESANAKKNAPIIDVGGGASTLVDGLLAEGFQDISVLDLSGQALKVAQGRLGERASTVQWIEGNILDISLPANHYAVWHDRAVFHFLTETSDRKRYLEVLKNSLQPQGHVVMATFAMDGPEKCSGLAIQCYSIESLQLELGDAFELIDYVSESHLTPAGKTQSFIYGHFIYRPLRREHG